MENTNPCWFCERSTERRCKCKRTYCAEHGLGERCMVCALGFGLYEQMNRPEPVSDILILSLSVAARNPYIVVPGNLKSATPLSLEHAELLVGALIQMLNVADAPIVRRAAEVLANTTNSWPTMDPSQLAKHEYGTGLLAADQVRRWLLHVLKHSRSEAAESVALAILDKLRSADFRELYPTLQGKLKTLTCSSIGTRVRQVLQAIGEFYPTNRYALNERCELFIYEQYMDRQRGAGEVMERMYGPRLRYAPELAKMLKKGVWHSNYERFKEWYPGEDEPV